MSQVEESSGPGRDPDQEWGQSLRDVLREVIGTLPDHATLGELIQAAQSNSSMARVLEIFTVQELIDTIRRRPLPGKNGIHKNGKPGKREVEFDEEGNPLLELEGPGVIRRRADVPDGDLRVLKVLLDRGPQRENDLMNSAALTSEQLRLVLRQLKTKGYIHVEGSGLKRRLKITRHGSGYLRRASAGMRD